MHATSRGVHARQGSPSQGGTDLRPSAIPHRASRAAAGIEPRHPGSFNFGVDIQRRCFLTAIASAASWMVLPRRCVRSRQRQQLDARAVPRGRTCPDASVLALMVQQPGRKAPAFACLARGGRAKTGVFRGGQTDRCTRLKWIRLIQLARLVPPETGRVDRFDAFHGYRPVSLIDVLAATRVLAGELQMERLLLTSDHGARPSSRPHRR